MWDCPVKYARSSYSLTVFGWSEIEKKEIKEREVGEKDHTSPVWYEENLERERLKKGGTYTFFFSLLACEERRKKWNNILIFQFYPYTSTKPFSFPCYMLQKLILELED